MQTESTSNKPALGFLFITFFKIGCTAFGGFMALVSVVQSVIVDRHRMVSNDKVLEGISLASVLPGPLAVNVVTYLGYHIRGWAGAFVCMLGVTLPSFLLITGLTAIYFKYGDLPIIDKTFAGFLPAVAAIILAVAWRLAKTNLKQRFEMMLALAAALLLILIGGFYMTFGIILFSALLGIFVFKDIYLRKGRLKPDEGKPLNPKNLIYLAVVLLPLALIYVLPLPEGSVINQLRKIGFTFGSMSVMLFGGGYVMIPFMQEVIVDGLAWVNAREFADGIAMGQITPGPIMISAAFIGYKVQGIWGAIIATIGIFVPPAVLMVIVSQVLEALKRSINVQAAMLAVKAAVAGMVAAAAITIGQSAAMVPLSVFIFVATLIAMLRFKVSVLIIIPVAGLLGYLFY